MYKCIWEGESPRRRQTFQSLEDVRVGKGWGEGGSEEINTKIYNIMTFSV